jgi:hypothetical protein
MAVSPGGSALYIANSDFDLQFNSGTVIALDLVQLRSYLAPLYAPDPANPVADPCLGLGRNPNPALQPGDCGPLDLTKPPAAAGTLLKNTVKIGAFATDLVFVCQPTDGPGPQMGAAYESGFGRSRCMGQAADPNGARLFAPVRGDPSLTFFDVDDDRAGQAETFKMECGQGSNNGRCANDHRAGIDSNRGLRPRRLDLDHPPSGWRGQPFYLWFQRRRDGGQQQAHVAIRVRRRSSGHGHRRFAGSRRRASGSGRRE